MAGKTDSKKSAKSEDGGSPKVLKAKQEDIYGVLLIAFGFFVLLSITTGATGIIGRGVNLSLQYSVGMLRYMVPAGLGIWGILFILKKPTINAWMTGLGMSVSFIGIVSIIHIGAASDQYFDHKYLMTHGGYLGAVLSFALNRFAGKAGGFTLAVACLLIGVIITANPSIKDLAVRAWNFILRLIDNISRDENLEEIEGETSRRAKRRKKSESGFQIIGIDNPGDHEDNPIKKVKRESRTVVIHAGDKPATGETGKNMAGTEYQLPPLALLKLSKRISTSTQRDIENTKNKIEETLRNFNVDAKVLRGIKGPTVTRFEIELGEKERVNAIRNLSEDICLALGTPDIRIINVIPGKSNVGIEVPNKFKELVTLGDILVHEASQKNKDALAITIGKDITGEPVMADLGDMPHLLIAGATGSGKSVCLNSILMTLLMRTTPEQVRMILIDPKRIELNLFNHLPHLLTPVVTDPKKAPVALKWAVHEMEERFKKLAVVTGARSIDNYNSILRSNNGRKYPDLEPLPYIIIIIDELADLMHVSASEVEDSICRLAQLARAVGIHLILATQRPSTDVITGLIKANIISRIAFSVSSQIDSRVILDEAGAEKLVGKGDMLFSNAGWSRPRRLQGALVTEPEIEEITAFIKTQGRPEYINEVLEETRASYAIDEMEDSLYQPALELIITTQQASVSMLQRRLKVGFARAGRLIDMLEVQGIVSPSEGNKSRRVLMTLEEYEDRNKLEKVD